MGLPGSARTASCRPQLPWHGLSQHNQGMWRWVQWAVTSETQQVKPSWGAAGTLGWQRWSPLLFVLGGSHTTCVKPGTRRRLMGLEVYALVPVTFATLVRDFCLSFHCWLILRNGFKWRLIRGSRSLASPWLDVDSRVSWRRRGDKWWQMGTLHTSHHSEPRAPGRAAEPGTAMSQTLPRTDTAGVAKLRSSACSAAHPSTHTSSSHQSPPKHRAQGSKCASTNIRSTTLNQPLRIFKSHWQFTFLPNDCYTRRHASYKPLSSH